MTTLAPLGVTNDFGQPPSTRGTTALPCGAAESVTLGHNHRADRVTHVMRTRFRRKRVAMRHVLSPITSGQRAYRMTATSGAASPGPAFSRSPHIVGLTGVR